MEAIGNAVADSATLFEAFLSAGFGASYGKLGREISRIESDRIRNKEKIMIAVRERQRYLNIISRLKRDGLLTQETKGRFRLTALGRQKHETLKKRRALGLPDHTYAKESSKNVIIVVFDIPERERIKRNWLRAVLKNLGLKMIQKSVWIGKTKIPKEFIDDIRNLHLTNCVEIIEVGKTGTLDELI